MTMVPATASRWKAAGREGRAALARAGRWARRTLWQGPWTGPRIALWAAGLVIALLAAAIVWLYFLDWNTMRGPVARYASARLHRPVRIDGDLDVHLFSFTPSVSVSGLKVANPDWAGAGQAADIAHLAFSVRLLPFLFGHTILPLVQFDRPDIVVVRRANGMTNWDFGGGNTGWNIPPIQRFLVQDGHIRIDDRVRKLLFTGSVSSRETAGGGGSAFQLTGNGTLNGNAFMAEVHGGPLINVDLSKPYGFQADIRAGATHIVADGTVTHPFHLGEFTATTTISGANLSNLYDLTGLAMPQTAPYRVSGTLTRDGALYQFRDFSGTVGSSDLRGSLKVDASGAKPLVSGAASSKVLDFKDLGALFGGKSRDAIATGRLLPDLPLHVDRLRQMDADVDYDAQTIRSRDFPLRGVHTHIALNNSVLVLKPLSFQFAYGKLGGSLRIDARNAVPVTSVDARVTDIKVQQFLGGGGAPAATGLLEARARLEGAGDSVQKVAASANGPVTLVMPRGGFNEKLAELTGIDLLDALLIGGRKNTNLRCAVAHFETHNGVMTSPYFVFDTDPVRIEGKGAIDLRDETLDMTLAGKPKEFRIGRLRAPIRIDGPLAHPHAGIEAGPLALQGGIAIALGILFPPAAILPFVDPGLAKDANCAGLLTAAKAQGAPVHRSR
ncbi:MAG: AsmA family protein [Rhizomicrobium sp.]